MLAQLGDAAVLDLGGGQRLAFTTDSYVVRPRFFPGGNIGDLAVNGTVNDLAMSGARRCSCRSGAILEEGMAARRARRRSPQTMGAAARAAGVAIVTGDTKVVDSGHGDGVYVNTAGIGLVPDGRATSGPHRVRPGDVVLRLAAPSAMHGVAVMSVRDGLEFGTDDRHRQRRR